MIDLRSDTFTLPTARMREAMAGARLGNDAYGEDPTTARLEDLAAAVTGKEAACLMPSGTMANLASLMSHCPRGTRAVVGDASDIYLYEAHGASVCGGIGYGPVATGPDGTLAWESLHVAFSEDRSDPQFALPAVICLENTHNRCGGVVLPVDYLRRVAAFARDHDVGVHLDGARVFNAAIALGVPVREITRWADSVQFCLSKGLCAPVGSMVAGTGEFIGRVRRVRKMLGGGLHQSGVIAAAGIVALEEMVDRLGEDHAHARRLATGLSAIDGVVTARVETNIVLFRVVDDRFTWHSFVHAAAQRGLRVDGFGHGRIRAVTYAGVTGRDVDDAVDIVARLVKEGPSRQSGDGEPESGGP